MYDDRDRRDPKRAALIASAWLTAIVVVIVLASVSLGRLLAEPERAPVQEAASVVPPIPYETATIAAEPEPEPEPTPAPAPVTKPAPAPKPAPTASGVVVIEAGHQAKGDSSLEPIGPGASERKAKVAGGATGVATGKPESKVNLEVALRLQKELESRGVKVIMVRTSQDVNISNSERAAIANEANAALFIRLHCDGSGERSTKGLSTLVPGSNQWTGPIVAKSGAAGKLVHAAVLKSTGAADRGIKQRTDLSGFNWSKVPTVLVEMGFLSNPDEDRLLSTPSYQDKLARGMADGIVDYLKR